ncbi:UNVERIFIED_CONTAM: hypothetical protein FKN15_032028 [Acipenser sinensis]
MPHLTDCSYYKVQTHLENSTKYHIQQAQRQRQYLTLGTKLANQGHSVSHPHPAQSLDTGPVMRNGHLPSVNDNSTQDRPVTLLTLAANHDNEVIFTSCSDMRWNKGTILKASVEYIKWLQKEQQRMRELENRQKKLEHINRRLLLQIQELEMQARAHGLPTMASSSETVDLTSHLMKQQQQQQPYQEDMNGEYMQQAAMSQISGTDLKHGSTTFSDPLSHFTDFSFSATLKEEHRLDEILMDDNLSPFGTDPLLSATSPVASKGSSRRCSFSTDDGDDL